MFLQTALHRLVPISVVVRQEVWSTPVHHQRQTNSHTHTCVKSIILYIISGIIFISLHFLLYIFHAFQAITGEHLNKNTKKIHLNFQKVLKQNHNFCIQSVDEFSSTFIHRQYFCMTAMQFISSLLTNVKSIYCGVAFKILSHFSLAILWPLEFKTNKESTHYTLPIHFPGQRTYYHSDRAINIRASKVSFQYHCDYFCRYFVEIEKTEAGLLSCVYSENDEWGLSEMLNVWKKRVAC